MQNININTIFNNDINSSNKPLSVQTLINNNETEDVDLKKLYKVHYEKKKKLKECYNQIYKDCLKKIKKENEALKCDTFFMIPGNIYGIKEYKKENCANFLIEKIRKNNIDVFKVSTDVLFITWINKINN